MLSQLTIDGNQFILSGTVASGMIEQLVEENAPVECRVALAAVENPKTIGSGSACVVDSRCTTYFFKSQDAFSIYKPLDEATGQSSKVGANFCIHGIGTVEIKVIYDNVIHTLEFTNVLHAPDITANLISISKMDLAGWEVISENNGHGFSWVTRKYLIEY